MPWRIKPRLPCERALKTESETGVVNEFTFYFWVTCQKTNSALVDSLEWKFPFIAGQFGSKREKELALLKETDCFAS